MAGIIHSVTAGAGSGTWGSNKSCVGEGDDLLIAAVWLRWRASGPAVDVLNEDVGAHVPTEKPAPPQGEQRDSMAPTERATTAEASVHTSAPTCCTGVPEETAILLANLLIVACAAWHHAPVVSTAHDWS